MNPLTNFLIATLLLALALATWWWAGVGGPPTDPLAAWRQAQGGTALERLQSVYIRSTLHTAGLDGTLEEWYTARGQLRQDLDLAGVYTSLTVFDGAEGWLIDPNGQLQSLQGTTLADVLTSAYLGSHAHLVAGRLAGATTPLGRHDGFDVVRLEPQGGKPATVYLDPRSHLPVKWEIAEGAETLTTWLGDWRWVEGVLWPFRLRQTNGDAASEVVIAVESVAVNPPLDAQAFVQPEPAARDFAFEAGGRALSIPIELNSNHIYLQTSINGAQPLWFVLDSGADFTVLDSELAQQLGLEQKGDLQAGGVGEAKASVALVSGVSFTLPGVRLADLTVVAASLGEIAAFEGRPIAGVLGYDFFSRFVVEIDYQGGTLSLYDPQGYAYAGETTPLPFTLVDNDPLIEAQLRVGAQTLSGQFLLDTGARGAVTLGSPFVEQHALEEESLAKIQGLMGFGVGGATPATLARFDQLELGSFSLAAPLVSLSRAQAGSLANPDRAGLIGGEVLRRFTVTFHYAQHWVALAPNSAFAEPFRFDMSGLQLRTSGETFSQVLVANVLEGTPAATAGILAGDEVLAVNGEAVDTISLEALRRRLMEPGPVSLQLRRGDQRQDVELLLQELL